MPRDFLLSILSYNLSYENVYAQLEFQGASFLLQNDMNSDLEVVRSRSLDKTSYRNLDNIFSYSPPPKHNRPRRKI